MRLSKLDCLFNFFRLDDFDQLLFEQFEIQFWVTVKYLHVIVQGTYNRADVVQQYDRIFDVATEDEFAHLSPLLDQFLIEVDAHVLVYRIVQVDVRLFDEALCAIPIALNDQEVHDQFVDQSRGHLYLVQTLPPELQRLCRCFSYR